MDAFEEFCTSVRRDINCLSDKDRVTRRTGCQRLNKALRAVDNKEYIGKLFVGELHKPLLRCFADPVEKVRDLSVHLSSWICDECLNDEELEDTLPIILAALLGRIRVLPFPEQSEELRLTLVRFLSQIIKKEAKVDLNQYSHEILDGISKVLTDTCPDCKKEASALISDLVKKLEAERIFRSGKPVVISLLGNLKHQHWKVRKATLVSLGNFIASSCVMYEFLEDMFPVLNKMLSDRNSSVRAALADVVLQWINKGLDPAGWPQVAVDFEDLDDVKAVNFDKYEHRLLYLLLNAVVDEDADAVGKKALKGMEEMCERAVDLWATLNVRQKKREIVLLKKKQERGEELTEDEASTIEDSADLLKEEDTTSSSSEICSKVKASLSAKHAYDYDLSTLPVYFEKKPPAVSTCAYVAKHVDRLLPQCLSNLIQWTSDERLNAAKLLSFLILLLNKSSVGYLDSILTHLYKAVDDDDLKVRENVLLTAQSLGVYVEAPLIIEPIAKHLGVQLENIYDKGALLPKTDKDVLEKTNVDQFWGETKINRTHVRIQGFDKGQAFVALNIENKRQVLKILAQFCTVFKMEENNSGNENSPLLFHVLRFLETQTSFEELMIPVLEVFQGLLKSIDERKKKYVKNTWGRAFDILLRCKSSVDHNGIDVTNPPPDTEADVLKILILSNENMEKLAKEVCECDLNQLYEEHLTKTLPDLLESGDDEIWPDSSPKRPMLDILLRNAVTAITKAHLDIIVPVMAVQAATEGARKRRKNRTKDDDDEEDGSGASARSRIDILGLVHFLVQSSEVVESLKQGLVNNAVGIFKNVLLTNATWRPGNTNNKIRKGAMVCIHQVMEKGLITKEELTELFPDLLLCSKSCMDDNFSPDNRMVATLVMTKAMKMIETEAEQLRDLYPELLKRLDDSNDEVRITVCGAFVAFFENLPDKWSDNLYEYILTSLFIHFDDPNIRMQEAVFQALEASMHYNTKLFLEQSKQAAVKAAHPARFKELMSVAENLLAVA